MLYNNFVIEVCFILNNCCVELLSNYNKILICNNLNNE